jgi:hypothetical protein
MPFDPKALLLLLKATKPETIDNIFVDAFRHRQDGLSVDKRKTWSESLQNASVEDTNAVSLQIQVQYDNSLHLGLQLFASVDQLIRECLYLGLTIEQVPEVFPKDFHAQLRVNKPVIQPSYFVL